MSGGTLEEPQVRAMFDRIAGIYDLLNTVMTAGLHHRWRSRAADLAGISSADRVLDLATGTGDLAFELATRLGPDGSVVGADFSERMLALAREKSAARATRVGPAPAVSFQQANAMSLPFAENSFDAATVAFGARNFADLGRGLHELARVVRPGGRVVILEMTAPSRPPLSLFFGLWFDRVVPLLGRLAGDPDAYSYLPLSVKRFPDPAGLAAAMAGSGMGEIRYVITAGGIIALHVGTVLA